MSKIKKLFVDYEDDTNLEVFASQSEIVVVISDYEGSHFINLDISTAISFSKELRKEINFAKNLSENE
jgi:hypothetical protein